MSDSFWQDWNFERREFQHNRKAKNAKRNLSLLDKNGIVYESTKTENIVLLKCNEAEAYMSTIAGHNELIKVKFKGSSKWHTFNRKKLIETFSPKK